MIRRVILAYSEHGPFLVVWTGQSRKGADALTEEEDLGLESSTLYGRQGRGFPPVAERRLPGGDWVTITQDPGTTRADRRFVCRKGLEDTHRSPTGRSSVKELRLKDSPRRLIYGLRRDLVVGDSPPKPGDPFTLDARP